MKSIWKEQVSKVKARCRRLSKVSAALGKAVSPGRPALCVGSGHFPSRP